MLAEPVVPAIETWGIRLSDRLREALAAGDLAGARSLLEHGDGLSRNLAKEYSLMYRGLGVTIRVMLGLLPAVAERHAGEATLAALVHDFCRELAGIFTRDWQGPAPAARTIGALAAEIAAAEALLARGEVEFDRVHAQNAAAVRAALDAGDAHAALQHVNEKVDRLYVPAHDRLIRFMADAMAATYRLGGAAALERFHFDTALGQKAGFDRWETLAPAEFARTLVFLLKQHMGEVAIRETPTHFVVEQKLCGSGGRLQTAGAYHGAHALPMVTEAGILTNGRPQLPVYCTHCPIWNGAAPLRWYGHAHFVLTDPARPDGGCTAHVYKRPDDVPPALLAPLRSQQAGGG